MSQSCLPRASIGNGWAGNILNECQQVSPQLQILTYQGKKRTNDMSTCTGQTRKQSDIPKALQILLHRTHALSWED